MLAQNLIKRNLDTCKVPVPVHPLAHRRRVHLHTRRLRLEQPARQALVTPEAQDDRVEDRLTVLQFPRKPQTVVNEPNGAHVNLAN